MSRTPTILAVLTLLALASQPLAAQGVGAKSTVRSACTLPAPPDSLRAAPTSPRTYLPDSKDHVVMEVESGPANGSWVEETSATGFGGDSYFRWNGSNLFGTPGVGVLPFRFKIVTQDEYLIRVHIRHDHPDPSEENDCWFRIDGGTWHKLFHNTGSSSVGVWTYNGLLESTMAFPRYTLSPGTHVVELSGRSKNFKIDRVHVLPVSLWRARVTDPESDVRRKRPVLGTTMRAEVGDPTNAAGLTPGATLAVWYAGLPDTSFPCGSVVPRFGEFLLSLSPRPVPSGPPQIWNGPGQPVVFSALLPNDPNLAGVKMTTQGVLYEPGTGKTVLTDALDLTLGDK